MGFKDILSGIVIALVGLLLLGFAFFLWFIGSLQGHWGTIALAVIVGIFAVALMICGRNKTRG